MKHVAVFSAGDERMKSYLSLQVDEVEFYNREVQEYQLSDIKNPEEITIVSSFTDSQWDATTIDYFPNLQAIATQSTGYDHIDIEYCKERGIAVYNVQVYGAVTVAEYACALILTLSRKIVPAYKQVQDNQDFSARGSQALCGFDLEGKTLAVIGVGNIGHNVIKRAHAFDMKIQAYDLHPQEELSERYGVVWANSLEEVVTGADIITVHLPYNEHTHHLINREVFASMQHDAVFINTSRGEVVDTYALREALNDGTLAQVALDVLEEEHALETEQTSEFAELNQELMADSRVVVTPHNAFNTKEALERIWQTTVDNILLIQKEGNTQEHERRVT